MTEQPVFSEQLIKALLPRKSRKIGNIKVRYAQNQLEIAFSEKVWLSESISLQLLRPAEKYCY
jgi:hypothetical protein